MKKVKITISLKIVIWDLLLKVYIYTCILFGVKSHSKRLKIELKKVEKKMKIFLLLHKSDFYSDFYSLIIRFYSFGMRFLFWSESHSKEWSPKIRVRFLKSESHSKKEWKSATLVQEWKIFILFQDWSNFHSKNLESCKWSYK